MRLRTRFFGVWLLLAGPPAHSVLFYSTADPSFNTTAPSGALTDSGWQFEGTWGAFLGTPIAPSYFITAGHVGGSIGQSFFYGGTPYLTTAFFDDPASDLRIWQVDTPFPSYAPLYSGTEDEVGKGLVVFGRGTQRGSDVLVSGGIGGDLKGWTWGSSDAVQRWGENSVSSIVDGGPGLGSLLRVSFDAGAGANEAHLSGGDSGGGVFIQEAGTWKLAGINYAVDGPYRRNLIDPAFNAALFDEGGLFKGGILIPDQLADVPGGFYATSISDRNDWIQAVVVPELSESAMVLAAALLIWAMVRRALRRFFLKA
jgi:hypothetical protein